MQSNKHSHYEAITNQIAGIVIGWCIVYFLFPFIGIEVTVIEASYSSAIFFVSSYARSYTVRRLFNRIKYADI